MVVTQQLSVLLTDVEGSTRLWETNPGQMAAALADHDRILREVIAAHSGRVFGTAGDSFAAAFPTVADAIGAAVAVQQQVQDLSVGGQPLRLRMGIHYGEIERRGDDYFGPVMNRTGRVRDTAHGGQIILTHTAFDQLDGQPSDITFVDLGEHRLRDLSAPVRLHQLCAPGLQTNFPPLRSMAMLSTNLPVQITSFIGRVQESAELEKLVRGSRLVTVTGAGGCGKSRLAVQMAAEMLDEFPDGIWLTELASVNDPDLAPLSVAGTVGMRLQTGVDPLNALTRYLHHQETLLVIDNCEHLVESVADLVARILAGTTAVHVLATSREPLRIRGEATYHLPTLPVPADEAEWQVLSHSDAVRLFAERAEAASPGFRLSRDNVEVVASICRRLDGIPLALELAASATRALTPDDIDRRLNESSELLIAGTRDDVAHHRTLDAAIDWSYQLLEPDEQAVFARLASFAGPFTLSAAEQVCAPEDGPRTPVLHHIMSLVDRSLLEMEEHEPSPRYRMLEPIRAFAVARLSERPQEERAELERRHFQYFLWRAEDAREGPISAASPPEWPAELDADTPDLHRALDWALEMGFDEGAVQLVGALGFYWWVRGRVVEAHRAFRKAPLHSKRATPQSRSRALRWAASFEGQAYGGEGPAQGPEDLARESLEAARESGDAESIAAALQAVGSSLFGEGETALAFHREAMAVARDAGDGWREALVRHMYAIELLQSGNLDEPYHLFGINREVARKLDDDRMLAFTLVWMGATARALHGLEHARDLLEQGLAAARAVGIGLITGTALHHLGRVYYLLGGLEEARRIHEEEGELGRREVGTDDYTAEGNLGFVDLAEGRLAAAEERFKRCLDVLDEKNHLDVWDLWWQRRALWGIGLSLARRGRAYPSAVLLTVAHGGTDDWQPWISVEHEHPLHVDAWESIESALSPKQRNAAESEAAGMGIDEAVAYALSILNTAN